MSINWFFLELFNLIIIFLWEIIFLNLICLLFLILYRNFRIWRSSWIRVLTVTFILINLRQWNSIMFFDFVLIKRFKSSSFFHYFFFNTFISFLYRWKFVYNKLFYVESIFMLKHCKRLRNCFINFIYDFLFFVLFWRFFN